MTSMLIEIGSDTASDSWGFVGTISVGEVEAYRTLEAFATPTQAVTAAQSLMADILGEILAGREWRRVRDEVGEAPRRQDFNFSALKRKPADVPD